MQLIDFLSTAPEDNTEALTQARAFTVADGRLIPATTINQLFAQLDLTGVIKDVSETPGHAARHKMTSVLLSIQGNHDFNFITGTAAGDGNLSMLDWLIADAMADHAPALAQFKQTVSALANRTLTPFANATLHDVLVARGVCPMTPLTPSGGYAAITTTAACEKHNPRLLALNPRTNNWQRVNNFIGVESAGVYDAAVPPQFNGWQLAVDNAYGVV